MASNMFLKLKGIEGGSLDEKHAKEIDVLAWSWGLHNSSNPHLGAGSGVGKVDVQDFQFVKPLDKASTALMNACAKGIHIETAELSIFKAGTSPLEYLTLSFKQVFITSVTMSLGSGEMQLNENVSMSFASYKVTMQPQNEKGASGGKVSIDFDIPKNK